MHGVGVPRDDFRAAPIQVVDHVGDRTLVAWNRSRGNHHRIATADLHLAMLADRHAGERGAGLALRSGGENDTGVVPADLAGNTDVAEGLRGRDVVDERASHDRDATVVLRGEVDHLLYAMNVRGER